MPRASVLPSLPNFRGILAWMCPAPRLTPFGLAPPPPPPLPPPSRELDLRILQEALSKEATDEAYETAERERRRDEVRRYREQLALMMEREAEETAERDAMILRAQLEQEAKRDVELAARDSARRRLMSEVDALRQVQIAEKSMRRWGVGRAERGGVRSLWRGCRYLWVLCVWRGGVRS